MTHAEHAERTVEDYAFWWHAYHRMVELTKDETETPERRAAFAIRRDNYARMMAEYRRTKPEPSVDVILAHRPTISTPEEIREGLKRQIDQVRKAQGL